MNNKILINVSELVDDINQSLDLLKSYGCMIKDDEDESFTLVKLVKVYDYVYETKFEEGLDSNTLQKVNNKKVSELINTINQSLELLYSNNCIVLHDEDKIFNLTKIVDLGESTYVTQFKEF